MLITDIINALTENSTTEDAVLDLLTAMAGEGLDSAPLDTLADELSKQGIDIDTTALFDVLENLAIVDNIKDDIVYFNTDSKASHYGSKPDPEKQDKQVSKLAKKQIDKEIKK